MITHEQLIESLKAKEEAEEKYKKDYYDYLCQCIQESGFADADVHYVSYPSFVGRLCVVSTGYGYRPFEIKFFLIRKDGNLSKKSTYIGGLVGLSSKNAVEELQKLFTLADKDS